MDRFQLMDDIESFYSIDYTTIEEIQYDMCKNCNVSMNVKDNNQYICPNCGIIKNDVEVSDMSTMASDSNYNTSYGNNSHVRYVGANAYKYQHLLRSSSPYSLVQEQNIKNILFECNYKSSSKINIPKDILITISEQFKQIRESGNIYRGTILRGILAAMTYYECLNRKLSHRPSEISEWFEIDTINYSKGDKIIRDLVGHDKLTLDLDKIDINRNFIFAYSTRLGFNEEQIKFLQELTESVTEQKIINPNAKPSTKALSIIYVYIMAAKLDITPDDLKERFNSSYGTIRSTSSELIKRLDKVSHIFDKYGVSKKIVRTRKRRSKTNSIEEIKFDLELNEKE
jgi:transcription initiation factor TFIIIB Brf1 subunit/transcription initiation factor TFIIB